MSNNWRLYTLEHVFISETFTIPDNFTGMARTIHDAGLDSPHIDIANPYPEDSLEYKR